MQAFDFTGKTVFVAGGTSGINLGIAEAFAEAGAKLVIVSRSQNHVDEAQRRLRVFDGKVVGFAADVRDVEAISAVFNAAHDSLGDIDILVSGAAGNFPSPALGMSANGFKAAGRYRPARHV
jgi:NAD(P)-dependent dehydrogenase (short-subunit alcohol dehydrogenase family)